MHRRCGLRIAVDLEAQPGLAHAQFLAHRSRGLLKLLGCASATIRQRAGGVTPLRLELPQFPLEPLAALGGRIGGGQFLLQAIAHRRQFRQPCAVLAGHVVQALESLVELLQALRVQVEPLDLLLQRVGGLAYLYVGVGQHPCDLAQRLVHLGQLFGLGQRAAEPVGD